MGSEIVSAAVFVRGSARPCPVVPGGETFHAGCRLPGTWQFADRPRRHNDILYDWAGIVAMLLRRDPAGQPWHLATMYLEFENNSGDPVSTPEVAREDGLSYYAALEDSPTRDYLRVPIIASSADITDPLLFTRPNALTFFGQTVGAAGVHGKEFSGSAPSRIYGAALVATPVPEDSSQDVVFSRLYYDDPDDQLVKPSSNHQIGIEYQLVFG